MGSRLEGHEGAGDREGESSDGGGKVADHFEIGPWAYQASYNSTSRYLMLGTSQGQRDKLVRGSHKPRPFWVWGGETDKGLSSFLSV